MGRARNNIAKLPLEARARISLLLDDGATYEEVRNNPEVVEACTVRGLVLHDTTFQAWIAGDEYKGYTESRRKYGREMERRKLAAYVVSQDSSSDDMARIAGYEMMRRVLSRLEDGAELNNGELRSLAATLEGYERNRIMAAKEDARREADAAVEKYRSRIAELEAKVLELSSTGSKGSLTDEQVEAIKERLGVR